MRTATLSMLGCGLALFGAAGRASADTVRMTVTGTVHTPSPADVVTVNYGGQSAAAYAGEIQWTVASTNVAGVAAGTPYGSFCVDLAHDIYVGSNYSYNVVDGTAPANLDVLGGLASLPTAQATATVGSIGRLYAADYATATTAGHNDQSAAFQITIWNLVYGTKVSFGGLSPSVQSLVAGYTHDAGTYGSTMALCGLQSTGNTPAAQDQLVAVPATVTPATPPVATPLPAAAAGGAVLLAGLAGTAAAGRRRPRTA